MEDAMVAAQTYLAKNYGWLPLVPVSARGCWIYNAKDERYLDLVACYSAVNFGYRHPVLADAAKTQIETGLAVNPGFLVTEDKALLAKELAEFCGMDGAMVVPMVSGAEAVETAMKLVRKWGYLKKKIFTNRAEIIFAENNFHGRTISIVSASTVPQYRDGFGPFAPGIRRIPFGSAKALEQAINENTVAFIVEPIQGEGGIVIPPVGYLRKIREICARRNVLLVFDEIQTGFGRTGKVFACDWEGVRPDLFTFGKTLGGGITPISAVVGRKEILEVFQPGDHGSTWGGNALACHVARAVLRLMRETHPENHSLAMGDYFQKKLKLLAKKRHSIKEVRGRGLMIGVEFRENGPLAHDVVTELFKEKVIAKETRDTVLRVSPPLTITELEVDFAINALDRALARLEKTGGRR